MVGFFVSVLRHTPINLEMFTELGAHFPLWQGVKKGKAVAFIPRFQASFSTGLTGVICASEAPWTGSALPPETPAGENSCTALPNLFPNCPWKPFPQPKTPPINYNLRWQGKIKPLHSYSRWKCCLEYGTAIRIPGFAFVHSAMCPWIALCQTLSWCFWKFFDQQDQLSEQSQIFVLFSTPMVKLESWERRFMTNRHGKGNNRGILGINQLSWTFTLWLHPFPQQ